MTDRLALNKTEAATELGLSLEAFNKYVVDELRVVRLGRRVLIPKSELERWLDKSAAPTLNHLESVTHRRP